MKSLILTCVMIFFSIAFLSPAPCWAEIEKAQLQIDGMFCPFCSFGLEKKLKTVSAIETIQIHLKQGLTEIKPKSGRKLDLSQIRQAVKEAGFALRGIELTITGTIVRQEGLLVLQSTGDGAEFLLFDSEHAQAESKKGGLLITLGQKIRQQLEESEQAKTPIRIEGLVHEHVGQPPGLLIQELETDLPKES